VFPAGLITFRVCTEDIGIDTDLIRYERDQWPGRIFVGPKESSRVSDQAKLHRKAEPILGTAAFLHQLQILVAEKIVFGKLDRFRWQGLESDTLCGRENRSVGYAENCDVFFLEKRILNEEYVTG